MLPSSDDIRIFLAVVEARNITRASEKLGLTQPSVSISIKRLEEQLQTPLFVREKRGVEITRAGERLEGHFRKLLESWERTRAVLSEQSETISGRFTIGCHPSVALYSLPHLLPKLLRAHPDLEVRIEHGPSREMAELLLENRIDLSIVVNPPRNPNFCIIKLCEDEVSFFAAANANDDVLVCDPNLLQSQALLKRNAKLTGGFRRQLFSDNLEVVTALTAAGAGVGIIPSRVVKSMNVRGLTRWRGRDGVTPPPVFRDEICLAFRPDLQRGLASKTLIAGIRAIFKQ